MPGASIIVGLLSLLAIQLTRRTSLPSFHPEQTPLAMATPLGGETVHLSLGTAANHATAHLLNLQGLAATSSDKDGGSNDDDGAAAALCDPSVTHADAPLGAAHGSHGAGYVYVPRTLIVDGRDAFGSPWGGAGSDSNEQQYQPGSAYSPNGTSQNNHVSSWSGAVEVFDASAHAVLGDQQPSQQQQSQQQQQQQQMQSRQEERADDPLLQFRHAASVLGLNPLHSRYGATVPSYNAGGSTNSSRHVQWDEEEEEEDDDYCYGDEERREEEQRRRLERMEYQQQEARRGWRDQMETSWEEAYYGNDDRANAAREDGGRSETAPSGGSNNANEASTDATTHAPNGAAEREIRWHDYWMPPRPSPTRYQVPLPFDTATNSGSDMWSSSFRMGYTPGTGGGMGNESAGIAPSWRENVLSESLRRTLEGCDVVKGFNVFVDGGGGGSGGTPGGGFHAGLASSLLEELSEECRSAGRWAVVVDPPSTDDGVDANGSNPMKQFRRRLNAGLALHGLSSNADVYLPVSIDGAHRALRGDAGDASPNRRMFEGGAAVALALEASTLFYRLRRAPSSAASAHGPRSRVGIQSGFYQGYGGGGAGYGRDDEPYATAPSLTYHEFVASLRSSSDRRRSILELDALLRPLSYPRAAGGPGAGGAAGGIDVASLLSGSGGGVSPSVMASLVAAGLIGGGADAVGELQQRMMNGTSLDRMRVEQQRGYRSSRGGSRSRPSEPGEWLEDISTKASDGGGLLSSLSGTTIPFGRRSDHHHFSLSTSLRPAASESRRAAPQGGPGSMAFLRPMMEGMGVKYRPEVSLGAVVEDAVADLTGVGSYWKVIFRDRTPPASRPQAGEASGGPAVDQQRRALSPRDVASHTPILSVLGNSTRSYQRLGSISTGFVDALHSRQNAGYLSRDVMAGVVPEKDDCEEALEYCQEVADVYEPPIGSGLVPGGDENDDLDAYFDEGDE